MWNVIDDPRFSRGNDRPALSPVKVNGHGHSRNIVFVTFKFEFPHVCCGGWRLPLLDDDGCYDADSKYGEST